MSMNVGNSQRTDVLSKSESTGDGDDVCGTGVPSKHDERAVLEVRV